MTKPENSLHFRRQKIQAEVLLGSAGMDKDPREVVRNEIFGFIVSSPAVCLLPPAFAVCILPW